MINKHTSKTYINKMPETICSSFIKLTSATISIRLLKEPTFVYATLKPIKELNTDGYKVVCQK
jgi:hypothetical protein